MSPDIPYKIAVLCYLYDAQDRLLLLHRKKDPNCGMYSPIGGKLETSIGEGPHQCAVREIHEEAGLTIRTDELHLMGIVSECAYESKGHWLIFLYEVTRTIDPADIVNMDMDEGMLEWVHVDEVENIDIPDSDRKIMWPLVRDHRGGYFQVHIDCATDPISWEVCESWQGVRT